MNPSPSLHVTADDFAEQHAYPRPQLRRADWTSLNGPWEFALDPEDHWRLPAQVNWQTTIQVPFAPETPASGVGATDFFRACWYRRTFTVPPLAPGERLLLHLGAVDAGATVWVNDCPVATHEGGYTPFTADLTDQLRTEGPQTLVVRAEDDPHDMAQPRGKQDWQAQPHSIWYPRTTGIWQTVWLERVPATYLARLRWTPCVERWELALEARLEGERRRDLRLHVRLQARGRVLAEDCYTVLDGEVQRRLVLKDPGIGDARHELLWSPSSPTLIEAELRLCDAAGQVLDTVQSYTALRSVGIQGEHFVLNGRPCPLRLVLDQGYWPETGLTAPHDDALRRDVELTRAMGFNGVRKHQKIEDPRYLYWADTLGLLVWEEMPSAYRYHPTAMQRLTRTWLEVIERDASHPCIMAWVPFNESWGVPDLPTSAAQRDYVRALSHLTRALDPTRLVIGNDGWESLASDVLGIHDYDEQPERLAGRYASAEELARTVRCERPGGRLLALEEGWQGRPVMLTEFGGIACAEGAGTWGYTQAETKGEFACRYARLLAAVRSLPTLAGFCYTQLTDTYQEANGLLHADRTPKFPLEQIAVATRGAHTPHERALERVLLGGQALPFPATDQPQRVSAEAA